MEKKRREESAPFVNEGADSADQAGKLSASFHPLVREARAVLFDAGGTLTHPDWERLARIAEQETGRVFETSRMRRALCETLREVNARLFEKSAHHSQTKQPGWLIHDMFLTLGVDEEACGRLAIKVLEAHAEKHLWCGLDPEAPSVVARLKSAGLRVGVISNTEDGRLEELLRMIEIASHFELLIDSHVVGLHKPDPMIFHHALKQLNIEPHEAVYVGDSYGYDVQGAQSAGLRAILLDPLDLHQESGCARIRALGELTGDNEYQMLDASLRLDQAANTDRQNQT